MTDIALRLDPDTGIGDFILKDGALALDQGLETAVIISLFADARAAADDVLPQAGGDRRGWWGDAVATIDGDVTGSKLWLLERSKITADVPVRAQGYAAAALAWLTADRIAGSVAAVAEAQRPQTLALAVEITRPTGPDRQRFDYVWGAYR